MALADCRAWRREKRWRPDHPPCGARRASASDPRRRRTMSWSCARAAYSYARSAHAGSTDGRSPKRRRPRSAGPCRRREFATRIRPGRRRERARNGRPFSRTGGLRSIAIRPPPPGAPLASVRSQDSMTNCPGVRSGPTPANSRSSASIAAMTCCCSVSNQFCAGTKRGSSMEAVESFMALAGRAPGRPAARRARQAFRAGRRGRD